VEKERGDECGGNAAAIAEGPRNMWFREQSRGSHFGWITFTLSATYDDATSKRELNVLHVIIRHFFVLYLMLYM
jgi:hypothetical protein